MKKNVEWKVTKEWFKNLSAISLWYAGIALIVWGIVMFVLHRIGETMEYQNGFFNTTANTIFMLVLGIVLPLVYLEPYIGLGISRATLGKGMFLAALLNSVLLAVLNTIARLVTFLWTQKMVVAGEFLVGIPLEIIYTTMFFLVGWMIALGFLHGKVHTATLSILCAVVVLTGVAVISEYPWIQQTKTIFPTKEIAAIVLITCIMGGIVWKGMKKVSIK